MSNKCFIKSRTYFLLGKFFNFCFENVYYEKTAEIFSISLPKTFVTDFRNTRATIFNPSNIYLFKGIKKSLEKYVQYVLS